MSGKVCCQSGHEVVLEAETGHGAVGDDTKTDKDGDYSFTGVQDGEYSATASDQGDYSVNGAVTQKGLVVYHDEYTDDKDSLTKYVGTAQTAHARWGTTRGGQSIMGYVANDGDENNLIRGDEAMAGLTVNLLTDVKFAASGVNAGKLSSSKTAATTETAGNGLYSFSNLNDATKYWVQVAAGDVAGGYTILSDKNPNLVGGTGGIAADNYPALPEESTYAKPAWSGNATSNDEVEYTVGTGAAAQSATFYNFGLVYTNGTIAGSVNNVSGSNRNIDVRITTDTDTDALWERATSRSGDFSVAGVIEGVYTAVIEDAGWMPPLLDDAGMADDDAECVNPAENQDDTSADHCSTAATSLTGTVEGRNDYQSMGTLHVYNSSMDSVDMLGSLSVMGLTSAAEDAEATDLAEYDSSGATQDAAGTNDIANSVTSTAAITWASGTVTVLATVSEDASYTVKIGTKSFAVDEDDGAEVELPYNATDAPVVDNDPPVAGTNRESTITISVTGKNGYNDHDYTFTLSRAFPVGYTLAVGDINVDGNVLSDSKDGLSPQNAWAADTKAGETTALVMLTLDEITGSTDCGQTVVVKDGSVVIGADEDSADCVPEYTLTGSTTGNLHSIAVTSQDGKTETYWLYVNNTPESS